MKTSDCRRFLRLAHGVKPGVTKLTPQICPGKFNRGSLLRHTPWGKRAHWLAFMPALRVAARKSSGGLRFRLDARLRWLFLVLAYWLGALELLGGCASRTLIPNQQVPSKTRTPRVIVPLRHNRPLRVARASGCLAVLTKAIGVGRTNSDAPLSVRGYKFASHWLANLTEFGSDDLRAKAQGARSGNMKEEIGLLLSA